LAEPRIVPAIDVSRSGTRKEEKLYPAEIVLRLHRLRRGLAGLHSQEAMTKLLELMNRCKMSAEVSELLARAQAPGARGARNPVQGEGRPDLARPRTPRWRPGARSRPAGPCTRMFGLAIRAPPRHGPRAFSNP